MGTLKGTYINGYKGEFIEVTDLQGALTQARSAVRFHREKMKRHETNPEEIIFPEAQKEWEHDLLELEKLEMKLSHIKKEPEAEQPKAELSPYPKAVMEARATFGEDGTKGFLKNDKVSPLFGLHSCGRSENFLRKVESLEVGESIYNSNNTKITRAR